MMEPADEETAMAFVRKCEKCGKVDDREQWSSPDEAANQGAFQNWTCPNCAWTEFDLVDAQAETAATQ
jgi:predicted nucleic-acid-binding Zn-ribbon protein